MVEILLLGARIEDRAIGCFPTPDFDQFVYSFQPSLRGGQKGTQFALQRLEAPLLAQLSRLWGRIPILPSRSRPRSRPLIL